MPDVPVQVYTFNNLGFTVDQRLPKTPSLIILMGQPGSGKSTVARHLAELGYRVYDEKEAGKLQKGQVGITAQLERDLAAVKAGELPGVVIDATNPTAKTRQLHLDLAAKVGVPAHVGWITRPGWESNEARITGTLVPVKERFALANRSVGHLQVSGTKVPAVALNTYASRLEIPKDVIRLI